MNEVLENYLHSIEDYVLVEDKIVTYKWISKALKIHVNTAKQLLHAFASKKEFTERLLVTYLIAGKEKQDSGLKFCLVKAENVDKVKELFHKLLSFHVYSVQRNSCFDPKNLYNADCTYELNDEDLLFSSIQKNEEIVKRSKPEVNGINFDAAPSKVKTNDVEKDEVSKKEEKSAQSNKTSAESRSEVTKPSEEKVVESKRSISPKKKSSKSSPTKTGSLKNKKLKTVQPSKGASIDALFNKQAANATTKKKELLDDDIVAKDKKESKKNLLKNEEETKITPLPKTKEKKRKRKKRDKEYESENKRRKRIMLPSDSDSSDSGSDMEVDELRVPSPDPEPVKETQESEEEIIPPTPIANGRKRMRKQINRTFTDEDGFILTKKEYVYESCTDDETPMENGKEEKNEIDINKNDELSKKETEASNDKKSPKRDKEKVQLSKKAKKVSPKKQKSITSFFKRK